MLTNLSGQPVCQKDPRGSAAMPRMECKTPCEGHAATDTAILFAQGQLILVVLELSGVIAISFLVPFGRNCLSFGGSWHLSVPLPQATYDGKAYTFVLITGAKAALGLAVRPLGANR